MLIGLTGGIGSGKSTVADIFSKYGFPVIDSDKIAREVVEPNKEAWQKIVQYFGKDVLYSDNTLNRKKLGEIIFHDSDKREQLNQITHPIIIAKIISEANELKKSYEHVIVEVPLLYESNSADLFDMIIVVYVDKNTQLQRVIERDQIGQALAQAKIEAQMSLEIKKDKADFVIYNDHGIEKTREQVKAIIEIILGKVGLKNNGEANN